MILAATQHELDSVECGDPNCDHTDICKIILLQKCHPEAGIMVIYDKIKGVLELYCHECKAGIHRIEVAP